MRGKSWCRDCAVTLEAAVFVRHAGAYGAGHIAWGWQWAPWEPKYRNHWVIGSVEDFAGMPVQSHEEMDYWSVIVKHPAEAIKRYGYDEYKVLKVPNADPDAALRVQAWVEAEAYRVLGRNCMDDCYDILRAYGATLPPPVYHWLPNHWYNHVAGKRHTIHYYLHKPVPEKSWAKKVPPPLPWQEKGVSLDDLDQIIPNPPTPPWRKQGTRQWLEFIKISAQGAAKDLLTRKRGEKSIIQMIFGTLLRASGKR